MNSNTPLSKVGNTINSKAYSSVKQQLKASLNMAYGKMSTKFNNKYNTAYEDIFGYGYLEEREDVNTELKFKISKSQYKKLIKNLRNIHLYQIFAIFELSKDEIQGLFNAINEGEITLKFVLLEFLEDKEMIERAIESIIMDDGIFLYIANCESYGSIFSNFARKIIKTTERSSHSTELLKLFERLEERIEEFPEDLKKKMTRNYISKKDQFLIYEKREILEKICKVMITNNEKPSLEFIEKYEAYFDLRQLVQLYKDAQEDIPYSEGISKYLKRQCEHRLRDELGPAAEAIEINMNWDMHTIALFDEINENERYDTSEDY